MQTGPSGNSRVTHDPQRASGDAQAFERLFQQVYLVFHRRDSKRSTLPGASRSVLNHLAHAGPLTIGELAEHLDRAQSVASDIVTGLERKGLLERRDDPDDRRRTLVWLTDAGFDTLRDDASVLSTSLLSSAWERMPAARAEELVRAMSALIEASHP